MVRKVDFDLYFDQKYVSATQTEFEKWFAEMALCVFGTDFEVIKAGGKRGDKKSDGRRVSTETVYQCYAPESPATFAKNASDKIRDSFPEVVGYWPNLREWIFVHNNDGLPTSASDVLEELREEYPEIVFGSGSRRFLKDEFHDRLSIQKLVDFYPSAALNLEGVRMEHIRPLLKRIISERSGILGSCEFGEIPDERKLDFNELSGVAKFEISRATPHVDVVQRYIIGQSNPNNANILQSAMRDKYDELSDFQYSPDEILGELIEFVRLTSDPTERAAAHVVVAYFFGTCDIFKNAPVS